MQDFTPGIFYKYRATTAFNLGVPHNRPVPVGTLVEFDGWTVKIGMETFLMPTLKGGILKGWLTPDGEAAPPKQTSQSAIVVDHEEQVVGQVGKPRIAATAPARPQPASPPPPQKKAVPAGKKALPNGQIVPDWFDDTNLPSFPLKKDFPSETAFSLATDSYNQAVINQIAYGIPVVKPQSFGGELQSSVDSEGAKSTKGKYAVHQTDGQQGVVFGQIKTSKHSAIAAPEGDPKLRELTGAQAPDPLSGESAGTVIRVLSEDNPERSEGSIRNLRAEVSKSASWQTPEVHVGSPAQYPVIDDGIEPAHTKSNIGIRISSGPELAFQMPEAQMTPTGNPHRKSIDESVREVIASWDKDRHWKSRVKEAVDFYRDSPAILEAIYNIESDAVVRQIKEAL